VFGTTFREEIPSQLVAHGVPQQFVDRFAGSGFRTDEVATVGNLGQTILASVPAQFRDLVEPAIPAVVAGIHDAFSVATAQTFLIGVGAAIVAAALCALLRELPLRTSVRETVPSADSPARSAEVAAP
ncbi:MAG: hypothetical protein ABR509_06645, partial [Candidatus Limnocylindria bacterium]